MKTPWPSDAWYLQVADLTVDLRFRRVVYEGQSLDLPQRTFDLLLLFLAEPDVVHSRTELFDRLWLGTIVEDTNLSQNVFVLRKALGESRKSWIHTVAKSGYIFQSPGPVQWLHNLPPVPASSGATTPADADIEPLEPLSSLSPVNIDEKDVEALPGETGNAIAEVVSGPESTDQAPPASSFAKRALIIGRRRYIWILGLAVMLTVAITAAWLVDRSHVSAEPRLTVALITIEDQGVATVWPAKLLEQWLRWKLGGLPDVDLLSESDLAVGNAPAAVQTVFISSVPSSSNAGRIVLHVRFPEDGEERHLEVEGYASDMPALADSLSRKVMAGLRPEHEKKWPNLELNAHGAQGYVQAMQAVERRDWMEAVTLGEGVVRGSPRFGLIYLQLARAYAQLSMSTAATAHMDQAIKLLASSPPPVIARLSAERLAMDPAQQDLAVGAYAQLAAQYPDNERLQLDYARLLVRAGDAPLALSRLNDPSASREPMSIRIEKSLLRAEAYGSLDDPVRVRSAANEAMRMANENRPGGSLDRASALLALGRANAMQFPERGVPPEFEQAALVYEKSGNSTGALHAHVLARLAAALPAEAQDPSLAALLARAHSGGYRRLEIDVLKASARQHARIGDNAGFRSRITQALAVATAIGDVYSTAQLELLLLQDDLMTARSNSAQIRIQRLSKMRLPSTQRMIADQMAADTWQIRGDFARSLSTLDRVERSFPSLSTGQADSEGLILLTCRRSQVLLRMGQLVRARQDLSRCARGDRQLLRQMAIGLSVFAETYAGDNVRARMLLDQAERGLPVVPSERWMASLAVAEIATRLGDIERSQRLYTESLPPLQAAGYSFLSAVNLAGQAENAAAVGDWPRSRKLVEDARRLVPSDTWVVVSRLDMLAAVDARQRGQAGQAKEFANALHQRAQRHGDVVVELGAHQLFRSETVKGNCSAAQQEALVARTGMRGVSLDWLKTTALEQK